MFKSLFNTVAGLIPYNFIKIGISQNKTGISQRILQTFNNIYFEEHLRTTASELTERFLVDLLTTNNAIYRDSLTLK